VSGPELAPLTGAEIAAELRAAAVKCVDQAHRWREDEDRAEHWRELADDVLRLAGDVRGMMRRGDGWRVRWRVARLYRDAWSLDDWDGVSVPASTATDILGELADTLAEDAGVTS